MLFAPHKLTIRLAADCFRKLAKLAAALAIAAPLALTANPGRLAAGDYDDGFTREDSGRFVRIGLNKSVVIRLPSEARDVIVGNPAVVDAVVRNKQTAYLFAKGLGQTNIFFFDAEGRQIMAIDLEVTLDMTALQKLIKRTLPGSRITADTVNDNVILGGTAVNASEAKMAVDLADKFSLGAAGAKVVNAIRISGEDQVMLKVRIVEIQRDILKRFGVDLSAAISVGGFAFNLASANPIGSGQFITRYTSGSDRITAIVRAMETDGLLRTLAEPNLTAVSGEAAKFHAGGEVAICGSRDDNGNCQTDFREFGVTLNFTPVVLDQGRISLRIATEVSELSNANSVNGVPGFTSRSAETTVELPSGGSMMLAGLIKDSMRQQIGGTPGLKDLPVLGGLFRSRDYTANETELVVIVTPYLVGPVHESQLATPADNFNAPTDRQTILFGRLNKVYGTPGKHPRGVYHGNIGFIVE
ncbi:MAG: type II and III secretion system protein family protein [Hyphomicrobiales bacterium]